MTKPTKWHVRPAKTDQPGHPPSLIRGFAMCFMGNLGPNLSSGGQRRFWSDWVDAPADLSLCWAHRSFCWFCHEVPHSFIIRFTVCDEWQIWATSWQNQQTDKCADAQADLSLCWVHMSFCWHSLGCKLELWIWHLLLWQFDIFSLISWRIMCFLLFILTTTYLIAF